MPGQIAGVFYIVPWSNTSPTTGFTCQQLLEMMEALEENATDTLWLTASETVFERLCEIYLSAGGSQDELTARWPYYFV